MVWREARGLRIAIVGVGMAGSYLLARLRDVAKVEGFEGFEKKQYFPICAWGTSINEMRVLAKNVGLNFDDYVLHIGKEILIDLGDELYPIKLKGLCTFDKLRFEEDLMRGERVKFGVRLRAPPSGRYDLVVDATGLNRSLLPRLKKQYLIPTLEYRVKYREPPFDDFYIKPFSGLSGYLWFFPLGDGWAHVGAGDYHRQHISALNRFLKKYGGKVERKIGRSIRITPPQLCQPFYRGNVVGVGEAIGTIYPMLGEGIIPSIQSAELLAENLNNLEKYARKVLNHFRAYTTVFEFIKRGLKKTFSWKRDWHLLLCIYLHMRFRESRYGIECRLKDIIKVVRGAWRTKKSGEDI